MKKIIQELRQENYEILKNNPKLSFEFDWSSEAYKLQHNEDMIKRLLDLKEEEIYVNHSNDGEDDVYCAYDNYDRAIKDCNESGVSVTTLFLYRG